MRKTALTSLALCTLNLLFAQNTFKKNDLYFEAGGTGLFGSINYERQITKQPGLGGRIGIGYYSENAFYLTIPVGINYLFPLKGEKSFIDAGLNVTFARVDAKLFASDKNSHGEHFNNFVPGVGYRRHTSKNVLWRISLTPVINKDGLVPWLGFSFGKRF